MSTIVNVLEDRLAARIKTERETRGWSLADLAEHSNVSRAMISKIERGEASPTAALLGRLSGAFGLTLSTLLARAEGGVGRLNARKQQETWRDPETGFVRRSLTPTGSGALELVACRLPPRAKIAYPAAAYTFLRQQIWILSGRLHFTEGATTHILNQGDCFALGPPTDCQFENRGKTICTYLVALARRE